VDKADDIKWFILLGWVEIFGMSIHRSNRFEYSIKIAFIIFIGLFLSIVLMNMLIRSTNAQDNDMNTEGLLTALKERMVNDSDFEVLITFAKAPAANDEELFFPFYDDQTGIRRRLDEIGKDFFCFLEVGGSSSVKRCVPFSNIVSISYSDE
jgi:hypothetical protein